VERVGARVVATVKRKNKTLLAMKTCAAVLLGHDDV
jgi:hypothetical protein